jgi:sortase A
LKLARLLAVVGIALLGWSAFKLLQARQYQQEDRKTLDHVIAESEAPGGSTPEPAPPPPPPPPPPGSVIGSLDIPRLEFSGVVIEGDDDTSLDRGIGHLPDTPLPWENGNSAYAGHRDTIFRPLKHIEVGDEMRLRTAHGEFIYRVEKTSIVKPTDVSVLDPTDESTLTLITCYPFNYVGHAPKRFIVQAAKVSASTSLQAERR